MKGAHKERFKVLMTFDEVSERYPFGRNVLYEQFRQGQIPGQVRIGRRWYVVRAVFERELGSAAA
jgi:hypothetical protein